METAHQTQRKVSSESVLVKALGRVVPLLGLSQAQAATTLGISPAQMSKLLKGEKALKQDTVQFQLAAMLTRIFRSLDAIVGGEDTPRKQWMVSENRALNGRPIDLIQSPQGLTHVLGYLDASRAKI